jgi:hypothetical protein
MKLHLGCGQRYFEGYVNIDYPLSEHSVQQNSVADLQYNLLELKYDRKSIDEVRLHHVFEHFSRSQACALLASWNSWLKINGKLTIEVPDFDKTAKKYFSSFTSSRKKNIALRHIFGSQEAHWAVHFEGYSKKLFKNILPLFGYKIEKFDFNSWKGTYNIVVYAIKVNDINKEEASAAAKKYLAEYMVSDTQSEQVLLNTWIVDFESQLLKSFV